MIRHRPDLQALECSICFEAVELRRHTAADPEKLVLLSEQMAKSHRACTAFPNDPERARLNRGFDERLRRELSNVKG